MRRWLMHAVSAMASLSMLVAGATRCHPRSGTLLDERDQVVCTGTDDPGSKIPGFKWKVDAQGNLTCWADESISSNPAKVRLAAARELYGPQSAEFFAGRVHFEGAYIWSRRWMEAQTSLEDTRTDRMRAAEAHLGRVREMEKWVKERAAAGKTGVEQYLESDFYRAAAEVFVSQVKDGPVAKTSTVPATLRLAAARLMYDQMWDKLNRARESFSVVFDWSGRILEAEMATRTQKAHGLGAAEVHLQRMKELEKIAKDPSNANKLGVEALAEVTFYRADAELLVSQLKAGGSNGKDTHSKAAEIRLGAAKAAYESMWSLFLDRRILPEFVYEWSIRWQTAAVAMATTTAEKISATEAHLTRMKELRKTHQEKWKGMPARHLLACEYLEPSRSSCGIRISMRVNNVL